MPRRPRFEIEGGLYHVITRGNDRCDIFHSEQDFQKFLSLLQIQKDRLPFFLYAFCLMTNHVHLLIERQTDAIGRIMHRVLTGYSQYYNRRYSFRFGFLDLSLGKTDMFFDTTVTCVLKLVQPTLLGSKHLDQPFVSIVARLLLRPVSRSCDGVMPPVHQIAGKGGRYLRHEPSVRYPVFR